MKLLLILVCVLSFTTVFAGEADTDCTAMNESRLNINKDKIKSLAATKGSTRQ